MRAEINAVHMPHGDVEKALGLARVVDRNDVRVIERGGELRFTDEAVLERLVCSQGGCEQLESDHPPEPDVLGGIDDAHASAAEDAGDLVAGKLGTDWDIPAHETRCVAPKSMPPWDAYGHATI